MNTQSKDQKVFADTVLRVLLNATGKAYIKSNSLPIQEEDGYYLMTPGQMSGLPTDSFRFKNERSKTEKIRLDSGNLKGRKSSFVLTKFDYVNKGNNMQYRKAPVKINTRNGVVNATCRYRMQSKKNSSVYLELPDGTFKGNHAFDRYVKAKIKKGSEIILNQI